MYLPDVDFLQSLLLTITENLMFLQLIFLIKDQTKRVLSDLIYVKVSLSFKLDTVPLHCGSKLVTLKSGLTDPIWLVK